LKKYIHINFLLSQFSCSTRNELFKESESSERELHTFPRNQADNNPHLRKFLIAVFLLFFTLPSIAPDSNYLILNNPLPVTPFDRLIHAVGMVETMGNVMAYNEFENAVGIFQIRQVRVDEYNRQTGNNYMLTDMFDYENSKKVFLHFASKIGPYNFERIAKAWNGSGPMTDFYWDRIKSYL
jgi:hypothetical protein